MSIALEYDRLAEDINIALSKTTPHLKWYVTKTNGMAAGFDLSTFFVRCELLLSSGSKLAFEDQVPRRAIEDNWDWTINSIRAAFASHIGKELTQFK